MNTDTPGGRKIPDPLIPGEFQTEEAGLLYRLKHEMMAKFERAGLFLTFDNKEAARGTRNGNFNLRFVDKFSLFARLLTTERDLGWALGDKGEVSYSRVGLAASDLANVGVHEFGHHFLDGYPGNDRQGHSEGIMSANYIPSDRNEFSSEQARFLRSRCN